MPEVPSRLTHLNHRCLAGSIGSHGPPRSRPEQKLNRDAPGAGGRGHRLRLLADSARAFAEDGGAGPLCTGLDVIPGGLDRVPEVGDLVAILDLGAYGYTESMPLFLSHPSPAEAAIQSGLVSRMTSPMTSQLVT